MKKLLLLLPIFVLIMVLSACNSKVKTTTTMPVPPAPSNTTQPPVKDIVIENAADEASVEMVKSLPEGSAVYEEYSAAKLSEYKGVKPLALFFHASWCPTCRVLNSDLEESIPNLTGITVLKIDYDTETELKKEYGITVQHTVVFLDADGNVVNKSIGTRLNEIIEFFSAQANAVKEDDTENITDDAI